MPKPAGPPPHALRRKRSGKSLMIPSTPAAESRAMSSSSLTVHTSTRKPRACAVATRSGLASIQCGCTETARSRSASAQSASMSVCCQSTPIGASGAASRTARNAPISNDEMTVGCIRSWRRSIVDQHFRGRCPIRRRALDLDVELGSTARLLQHVFEARHAESFVGATEPGPGIESSKLGERSLAHRPLPGNRAAELAIVQHDEMTIAASAARRARSCRRRARWRARTKGE